MAGLIKTIINIPEEDMAILDGIAAEKKVSRAAVVRWAISLYLEQKNLPVCLSEKTNDLEDGREIPLTTRNFGPILRQALAEVAAQH